ncbi:MAG: Crp/Fnr family transcriptional regulator [Sphingobacteriia bacterium]|jgi:CRP-like cAMP-binding protein|nr:Crp/Fnr family transcriptional regulator [Sphingobacteriia bacterium]
MIDENTFVKYINEQLGLPIPLAENIVSYFDYKIIPKNTLTLKAGEICDNYMFIHKGIMRSYILDSKGIEITTNIYTKNQVAIEQASFFNRSISCENIQTLTDCAVWFVDFQKMNQHFNHYPEHREFGRRLLVRTMVELKERMILLQTETAENRYLLLLKQNPEILKYVPLKQIASYLGVTNTSLSRIRKLSIKK